MENPEAFEPSPHNGLARRIAGAFIAGIRFVGRQLAEADLNPHEGRLRRSAMPGEYIQRQIPDYPPIHDDTL